MQLGKRMGVVPQDAPCVNVYRDSIVHGAGGTIYPAALRRTPPGPLRHSVTRLLAT